MRNLLQSIENKLRYLLEDKLDRLIFPGVSSSLSYTLTDLIQKKIKDQDGSEIIQMPDLITLKVSPERWDAWQQSLPLLTEVSTALAESWDQQGFTYKSPPIIQLLQSADLSSNQLKVETDFTIEEYTSRQTALQKISRDPLQDNLPKDACLILKDQEPFFLTKAIVNIGRRSSNDIVLTDPLISRNHLQLRLQNGKYYLFDLGSKGGTKVNNHPANNLALEPGDVIQIGNTDLIYNHWIDQTGSDSNKTTYGEQQ